VGTDGLFDDSEPATLARCHCARLAVFWRSPLCTSSKFSRPGLTSVFVMLAAALSAAPGTKIAVPSETQVVFLGTGAPPGQSRSVRTSDCDRRHGVAYLVDLGPGAFGGLTPRPCKAHRGARTYQIADGIHPHLHSDTRSVSRFDLYACRSAAVSQLTCMGPRGIKSMTEHLHRGVPSRYRDARKPNGRSATTRRLQSERARDHDRRHLSDSNVTVTAFPTKHAMESYGYRFDTADRSIVISG